MMARVSLAARLGGELSVGVLARLLGCGFFDGVVRAFK